MNAPINVRNSQLPVLDEVNLKQHRQLLELVKFARTSSPYFRELYRGLPDEI